MPFDSGYVISPTILKLVIMGDLSDLQRSKGHFSLWQPSHITGSTGWKEIMRTSIVLHRYSVTSQSAMGFIFDPGINWRVCYCPAHHTWLTWRDHSHSGGCHPYLRNVSTFSVNFHLNWLRHSHVTSFLANHAAMFVGPWAWIGVNLAAPIRYPAYGRDYGPVYP